MARGFDAHYHHFLLSNAVRNANRKEKRRCLAFSAVMERADPEFTKRHPMAGGVASFCFPHEISRLSKASQNTDSDSTFMELLEDPRLMFALGIHPKSVANLSEQHLDENIDKIRELSVKLGDRLVAVGEIGLDYTMHSSTWKRQLAGLRRLLTRLSDLVRDKIVVLHLRSKGSRAHEDASCLLRDLSQSGVLSADQHVQLHYFRDSEEIVRRWRQVFPNTYFSIPCDIASISQEQRRGIKAIFPRNLLLESDSSAAKPIGEAAQRRRFSVPMDIFLTANILAPMLKMTPTEVVNLTRENAEVAFRLHHQ